jgi:menaquinol-cytochrome c reductase iron-sulfur subunit
MADAKPTAGPPRAGPAPTPPAAAPSAHGPPAHAPSGSAPPGAPAPGAEPVPRRRFLMRLGIGLNAVAGALAALPIVGYLFSPVRTLGERAWVRLGPLENFPEGETRLATYRNPFSQVWDGATANISCYVRHLPGGGFQVFAVNCTHLGCPVRWFPQSGLFMCPCHGGAYYADGARASGPPPRGLFEHAHQVRDGQLWIRTGHLPTLASPA